MYGLKFGHLYCTTCLMYFGQIVKYDISVMNTVLVFYPAIFKEISRIAYQFRRFSRNQYRELYRNQDR